MNSMAHHTACTHKDGDGLFYWEMLTGGATIRSNKAYGDAAKCVSSAARFARAVLAPGTLWVMSLVGDKGVGIFDSDNGELFKKDKRGSRAAPSRDDIGFCLPIAWIEQCNRELDRIAAEKDVRHG